MPKPTEQVMKEAEIGSPNTLTRYYKLGLIDRPEMVRPESGRGWTGMWSDSTVERCIKIRELRQQGYGLKVIRRLLGAKTPAPTPSEAGPAPSAAPSSSSPEKPPVDRFIDINALPDERADAGSQPAKVAERQVDEHMLFVTDSLRELGERIIRLASTYELVTDEQLDQAREEFKKGRRPLLYLDRTKAEFATAAAIKTRLSNPKFESPWVVFPIPAIGKPVRAGGRGGVAASQAERRNR